MPSAIHSFVITRRERLIFERLKGLLLAIGTRVMAQRMAAAQSEIERGRERLWIAIDQHADKGGLLSR
jgi:hypothetical protein